MVKPRALGSLVKATPAVSIFFLRTEGLATAFLARFLIGSNGQSETLGGGEGKGRLAGLSFWRGQVFCQLRG